MDKVYDEIKHLRTNVRQPFCHDPRINGGYQMLKCLTIGLLKGDLGSSQSGQSFFVGDNEAHDWLDCKAGSDQHGNGADVIKAIALKIPLSLKRARIESILDPHGTEPPG